MKINTVPQIQGPVSLERETICILRALMISWKNTILRWQQREHICTHFSCESICADGKPTGVSP